MSFSGGVYTLPGPALVTGEVVSATENNQFRNDVAGAFNLTMLRNGTSTATANLPMGGYKLTGLGAPSTNGDSLAYGAAAVVTTLTSSSLTATRVPYAGTGGLLQDASTFTFDGTTLTAGGFTTSGAISAGTITASGAVTVSGGTANGVAYLNGSKVLTTGSALTFDGTNFATTGTSSATKLIPTGGSATGNGMYLPASNTLAWSNNGSETMRLDSSGNLGLGVTPSVWESTSKAFQFGALGYVARGSSGQTMLGYNNYLNASNQFIYAATTQASRYEQVSGEHRWFNAPSGTAGNAISFTQAMTLDASGNLGVGITSPGVKLDINGGIRSQGWGGTAAAGNYFFGAGATPAQIYGDSSLMALYTNGSERMRIDSSGNVGIGTSSPAQKLDVQSADYVAIRALSTNSSIDTRLQSYSTGNYGYVGTVSNHAFSVITNNTERMRIDSSGNLLVGKTGLTDTGAGFALAGTGSSATGLSYFARDSGLVMSLNRITNSGDLVRFVYNSVSTVGTISTNGTSTTYGTSSDYRLKENIQPMQNALARNALLKPCTYSWKADGSTGEGFIAHELQAICPDAVTGEKDAVDKDGKPVYQGVDTSFLVGHLVACIQELKAELDELKAKVG